jgi:hypothetical protein
LGGLGRWRRVQADLLPFAERRVAADGVSGSWLRGRGGSIGRCEGVKDRVVDGDGMVGDYETAVRWRRRVARGG